MRNQLGPVQFIFRSWQQRAPENSLRFYHALVLGWLSRELGFPVFQKSAGFSPFIRIVFFRMHRVCVSVAINGEILLIRVCGLANE